jgi:hypothetical protein
LAIFASGLANETSGLVIVANALASHTKPFIIVANALASHTKPFIIVANALASHTMPFIIVANALASHTKPFIIVANALVSHTKPFDPRTRPLSCYLRPMRHPALVVLLALLPACGGGGGGASAAGAGARTPADDADRGFSEYAAVHGIRTLNHPEEAPEVTADGLRLEALDKKNPVKLDGILNEWPAPAKATELVRGSTKSGLKITLQYDETKLYVGAEVTDASFAPGKDHVSLVLAIPEPGGAGAYASYELGFFAGKPGESAGSVRYGSRGDVPGAKIVEAPTFDGYTFEATVPLGAIPEMRSTRVGIHGVAAYVDADAVIATGPGDAQHPRAMAWVPSEPELSLIEQLLAPKGLTKIAPAAEIVADLTGDGVRERIAVFEHYLTICGTSYLGGTGFFYRDLVGELVKLEVRDVSGRGKGDVVVRRRQSVGDGTREYLEILSALTANQEPRLTFAHEIGVRQSDRHIDNTVHMSHGEIELSVDPPTGWDATSYHEPLSTEAESVLFPWGGVRSRVYRFDGSRFASVKAVTQKEQGVAGPDDPSRALAEHPPEPPTPHVERGGDLSAQVLDRYRKDRGMAAGTMPKVDLKVQVAGDARPERVLLIGRDVVVFGPGFKDGASYAFATLEQFGDPNDIRDLSARDLTGDGAADLIVRGVRHVTAARASVDVEVMLVYEVGDDSITRVFGIETAREQQGKRVQGLVQFIPAPGGHAFDILSAPGRASGWSAKTYPWGQNQPGASDGDIEPLLLPWGGIASVRYTWNGSQFVKSG